MEAANSDTVQMRERTHERKGTGNMATAKSDTGNRASSVHFGDVDRRAEKKLRRWLKMYFYNWCKAGGGPPCFCSFNGIYIGIFTLQLIKVLLISIMLISYGKERNNFNSIVTRGHTTLRHLLLKDWDASWETPAYPPSQGEFAAYKTHDLYERINDTIYNYHHIEEFALGYFMRLPGDTMTATLQMFHLNKGVIENVTEPGEVRFQEVPIHPETFDFETITESYNASTISRMLSLTLKFTLHSVSVFENDKSATLCLESTGEITFKNKENDGQVVINLGTVTKPIKCKLMNISVTDWEVQSRRLRNLAKVAPVFCGISVLLSIVSAGCAIKLFKMTWRFMRDNFHAYYKSPNLKEDNLPWREYLNFVPYWDYICFIADVLVIHSSSKLFREEEDGPYTCTEQLDSHTIGISVGALLAWCSMLQFLNIHHKFGLLFKTINRALFNVVAFLVCAFTIFFGYLICGYVVFGPYHSKFRKFSSASETLAAITFGDEMYSTFYMFDERVETSSGSLIWYFTRFYLFSIIAIFIFVVTNLIMAIILSAYEAIKQHYGEEESLRDVAPLEKALYRFVEKSKTGLFRNSIFQMLQNEADDKSEEALLRAQFLKFCRVTEDGDIVRIRPRTVKAFMEDGDDVETMHTGMCCWEHVKCMHYK